MAHLPKDDPHAECLLLPLSAVRFPIEWQPPEGFRPEDPSTWPRLEGRLEFLDGRIRYLPPCGGIQQYVASNATGLLWTWTRTHPEFVVGSNEAGMLIAGAVRAADAAVWRRADAGKGSGYQRTAPILAVEIAGQDEAEATLREKAAWYLSVGVEVVWLLLPESREVVVLARGGESRHGLGDSVPSQASLPGLEVRVADLFWQVEGVPNSS